MFGSRGKKYVILSLLAGLLAIPSFASDGSEYSPKNMAQNDFGDYMIRLQDKITKEWNPPDVMETGHASVIFKIDRNGNVLSSYIKESSGDKFYDESALLSIQHASPYPEFPSNITRDSVTIQYSFDSSIVKTDHIKELVALADSYAGRDNSLALKYINQAIKEIEGNPAAYFLYARRQRINKMLGDVEQADKDLAECKRLKAIYNEQRIKKCKDALAKEETPFGYFTLANAYDLAGDYQNAVYNLDKAIAMTELNHAYKRYRAEIIMKNNK